MIENLPTLRTIVVTGAAGLIGSECVQSLSRFCNRIVGIDCDKRSYFFGKEASTKPIGEKLSKISGVVMLNLDITNYEDMNKVLKSEKDVDMIIHTAAQPSHDWAAKEPLTDFNINATGTMNMLELYRRLFPEASFVFTSTNKVYGDRPNYLNLREAKTRYDYEHDIDESMSIDSCKHSIFGASKVAADIMVQEYGRYFGLNTVSFRCGCLTGGNHRGAKLHGFLSYLTKCMVADAPYTIFGYKGKQVRDNLHSRDLVKAFLHYHRAPKPGAVYNIGGGRKNSVSILEAINLINDCAGLNWSNYTISEDARLGDHKWYITDNGKFMSHYGWVVETSLRQIIGDMI